MNTVLNMEGISKTFPGVRALDKVDFRLKKGTVHILLGENGAGKSTLVKILSGAHQLTAGRIFINGQPVVIRNPRQATEAGIGIIYQELNLIGNLSVAENIYLGREPVKQRIMINDQLMKTWSKKVLGELGVDIDPDCPVKELGIAQQQMVEVAKALVLQASILIMDEPTSALTESEIKELFAAIMRLKQSGVSIIYISHRMDELFEIGDEVTVLRDGQGVGTRLIGDTSREELIRMMVNRELDELFIREQPTLGREVLRVENLTRSPVLNQISFSLRQGELIGISGLLGAGRTELARALFGVDSIDSGAVFIHGRDCHLKSPRAAINNGIGFLTEDRKSQGLVMTMSVKENITLPNLKRFANWGVIDNKREEIAADQHCRELNIRLAGLEQLVFNLSGGNQQKVVLSKWLCSQADIFIFDEPTRGIDVGTKQEFYRLMNELTARGVAIIVISSDLPELFSICDRILVLHNGTLAGQFNRHEFDQERILSCALGGAGEA
ncbi:MAG: sugar ABC transporter ATP-binding protein [Candidatus Neomarinimicrobiota bacterium]